MIYFLLLSSVKAITFLLFWKMLLSFLFLKNNFKTSELISPPPTTTSTPKRSRASAQKVKEETEKMTTVGETLMKMKDKERKEENGILQFF